MNPFFARNRLILLAYAGAAVLLLVTAQVTAGTPMAQAPQWQQSQGVQWLDAVRSTAASILSGKLEK